MLMSSGSADILKSLRSQRPLIPRQCDEFKKIKEKENANYATWFTLLILMDMIYMDLYEKFAIKCS